MNESRVNMPVSVIGLGPMGQAMTKALMTAGHRVTVWNRTPARASEVVSAGATLASTATEAVAASDIVILSLTDYQAMYDVLGEGETLAGRTVVNLSSDTPARTEAAADWATQRGAQFLSGGVMVPAPMVGTEASYVYYSGPRDRFEQHHDMLSVLGAPHYLGTAPGLAQAMYLANLDIFLTTLSSLLHGIALLHTVGSTAADSVPELMKTVAGIPGILAAGEDLGPQLDSGNHPGHLSTVTMMGATADHIVEASRSAGINLSLPLAVQGHYRRAIADGHGADNWTRLIEGIRRPDGE